MSIRGKGRTRLHVRLRFVSIGVRSCRWVVNCRDAVFRSCAVGTWAVRRGSPLSENDGRLPCSMVNLAAHVGSCILPSGATPQRHGVSVYTVKTLSVLRVYEDDPVFYVHCARGPCMFGPRGSLTLCRMHFCWHTHVDHRVVWHIISTLCFSMCGLVSFCALTASV